MQTDFSIDNINIKLEKSVKRLGVELDDKLKFDIQVSSMCKKAAKQLNALKRISHLRPIQQTDNFWRLHNVKFQLLPPCMALLLQEKSLQAREDTGTSHTLCLQGLQKEL